MDLKWVRDARKKKKLSQGDLGQLVGIGQAQISRWERGLAKPTDDLIIKLRQILLDGQAVRHMPAIDRSSSAMSSSIAGSRRVPASRKLAPYKDLMGTVPDYVIAERSGVSVRTILSFRRQHGILAYDRHRGGRGPEEAAPPPVVVAAPAVTSSYASVPALAAPVSMTSVGSSSAWEVVFAPAGGGEEVSRIVVASGVAAAAMAATRALGSSYDVRTIRFLGEAIV
jgi:transcriptional regulator with XRE-family HTH domain